MSVMFILLPLALLFAGAALLVFIWAARAGQFDDLETPALRILHDDAEADGVMTGRDGGSRGTAEATSGSSARPRAPAPPARGSSSTA